MGGEEQFIDDKDFFKEIEKYNNKREKLFQEITENLKKIFEDIN